MTSTTHEHPARSPIRDRWLRFGGAGPLDHWCLSRLVRALAGAPVRLQLWNGTSAVCSDQTPIGTVTIHDRATLGRLLVQPALEFGEAYMSGRLTVQGDLVAMLEGVNRSFAGRPFQRGARRPRTASRDVARRNVHHYELGNDFYRLWLDDAMVYTCAYFDRPDATLEEAQRAKLDYVCRKLDLQPGEHVVEAGCGWGALALHMARHYGVTVHAYNISTAQLEYARERAIREGLDRQVTFIGEDYRSIDGRCDAFVSIGMLEHVGRAQYETLGGVVDRVLDRERGRGLFHFIGRNWPMEFNPWITRRIFPGAYAPALGEVMESIFERQHLSVADVENLRLHYARTLDHWLVRFEQHASAIATMFDDAFVRMWRLYLASAQACFRSGDLQLFQVTFGRATDNSRPWTRDAWSTTQTHGSL
ncbi:MAG TPA: cyclopropane-fatty-acyl-phospholipid synthase family protein [Vicinamibacterales bacterium]|nr:cyclopropane-fatty-acyl-phospholipid synthase family protein [Vicinamibacterales bacterium]